MEQLRPLFPLEAGDLQKRAGGPVPQEAHRADAPLDPPGQVVVFLRPGVGSLEDFRPEAPTDQVIRLDRALLMVDAQFSPEVQRLQHRAGQAGIRPKPVDFLLQFQVAGRDGAVLLNKAEDIRDDFFYGLSAARTLFHALPVARESAPILRRVDGQALIEVIRQGSIGIQKCLQHGFAIAFDAGL